MVVPSYLASSRNHPFFDSQVVHEWYGQLAEAAHTPGLAQHLVRHMGELLPRFVAYYQRLKSLPRRVRRALARCRGISLAGVALFLALCGGPLHAATITVDETTCRLGDAIVAANTDTATGGCTAGSGEDVIVLDADVTLGAALPTIVSDLTIEAGLAAIIDGAGNNACVHVYGFGVDVILDGLTVRNCVASYGGGGVWNEYYGNVAIANCNLLDNTAMWGRGGGIYSEGPLTITESTISGNTGGGIYNRGTLTITNSAISGNTGGGIYSYGSLSISDSVISGNTTGGNGGGLYLYTYDYPTATLTNCVISGNTAASKGGGVMIGNTWTGGGFLDIRSSTISGNTATSGGGVASYNYSNNAVLLTQSTVSGNTATAKGGAVYVNDSLCFGCYLTFTNTTISGNEAGQEGGGILTKGGNYYSSITLAHALISGNEAPTAPEMSLDPSVDVYANNFNLVGYDGDARSEGFTPGPTDIVPAAGVFIDDILAPLAFNGGPTYTHAVVPGSPAIDAIPASDPNCQGTTDQRGRPRPHGIGCEVGSFEVEGVGAAVTRFTPRRVLCLNQTTGQRLRARPTEAAWDCEALGLLVQPGDVVQTSARGAAADSEVHLGGAVTAMTPEAVFCENEGTGMKVRVPTSTPVWDCEALGLVVQPGDVVLTGAIGTAGPPEGK